MTERDTQKRILCAASKLFAEKGVEGTSMRDLAKQADVSLSAINYHFDTKEKLAEAVLNEFIEHMGENVRLVDEKTKGMAFEDFIQELCIKIFEGARHFASSFKMVSCVSDNFCVKFQDEEELKIGPPGSRIVLERLKSEVGELEEERLNWVVKTLYCQIDYFALFTQTCIYENPIINGHNPKEKFIKNLRHLTRSLIAYAQNPDNFA